jgi:hypothetical protein
MKIHPFPATRLGFGDGHVRFGNTEALEQLERFRENKRVRGEL